MRPLPSLALALSLLAAPPAPCAAPKDARALVERAVKAQGGLEKLQTIKATHARVRGYYRDHRESFTAEVHTQSPGKMRMALTFKGGALLAGPHTLVVNGKRAWLHSGGMTQELDQETVRRTNEESYGDHVSTLVPLLTQKGFTLTALGESEVEGKPVAGVKVAAAGKPEVSLYFSRESGLLVKSAHRAPEPGTGAPVLQETFFRTYIGPGKPAADEALLARAKVPTDGPGLLAYLREAVPDEATRRKAEALVTQLGDASFARRKKASAELIALGPAAVPFLRQARKLPDIEVARRAEKCLEKIGDGPGGASLGAVVRRLAARQPEGAAEALLQFYPWAPSDETAEDALAGLALLTRDGKHPESAVVAALNDRDPRRREAAAAVLGKDGGAYLNRPGRRLLLDGVRRPGLVQILRGGRLRTDYETLEYHVLNRLDDKLFERPE